MLSHRDLGPLATYAIKGEKYSLTLVKLVGPALFRTITLGIGLTVMGFYSAGERWGSTPNVILARGNIEPRRRVGGGKLLRGNIRGILAQLTSQDSLL